MTMNKDFDDFKSLLFTLKNSEGRDIDVVIIDAGDLKVVHIYEDDFPNTLKEKFIDVDQALKFVQKEYGGVKIYSVDENDEIEEYVFGSSQESIAEQEEYTELELLKSANLVVKELSLSPIQMGAAHARAIVAADKLNKAILDSIKGSEYSEEVQIEIDEETGIIYLIHSSELAIATVTINTIEEDENNEN